MTKAALILMLGFICATAHAEPRDSAFYVSPRLGKGEIKIRQRANVSEVDDNVDSIYAGVAGGWISPIGVLLEVGHDTQSNFDWFTAVDEFTLEHNYALIGYEIRLGSVVRVTPKFGRSQWSLRSREGALLHPGPEEVKKVRGYQDVWEVEMTGRVSKVVSLGAAIRNNGYDFGRADNIMFVAKFEF
jgi:hypothetical protein